MPAEAVIGGALAMIAYYARGTSGCTEACLGVWWVA